MIINNDKQLLIIKISGESLKSKNDIINADFINDISVQIKEISNFFKIAIVLGGGNIWRGTLGSKIKMQRVKADQMGMLATVINSIALESALNNLGLETKIYSTIEMDKIADNYIISNIKESLKNNKIILLTCGIGRPFFSTDTGIALSAAELNAKYILMGKNNVDGVYDSDPNINPNAKFFKFLTYSKALNDELKVMDSTASSICRETKIKTIVFKINEKNCLLNVLNNKSKFTLISEDSSDFSDNFCLINNKNFLDKISFDKENKINHKDDYLNLENDFFKFEKNCNDDNFVNNDIKFEFNDSINEIDDNDPILQDYSEQDRLEELNEIKNSLILNNKKSKQENIDHFVKQVLNSDNEINSIIKETVDSFDNKNNFKTKNFFNKQRTNNNFADNLEIFLSKVEKLRFDLLEGNKNEINKKNFNNN